MVLDPKYITDQTWDFPAAAATDNKSSSILLASSQELVGLRWPICEALTGKMGFETTEDPLDTSDADATWDVVVTSAGVPLQVTGTFTAAGRMAFDPAAVIIGGCRVRLVAFQANGTTAANQDEQVIKPKFRALGR